MHVVGADLEHVSCPGEQGAQREGVRGASGLQGDVLGRTQLSAAAATAAVAAAAVARRRRLVGEVVADEEVADVGRSVPLDDDRRRTVAGLTHVEDGARNWTV